MEQLESLMNQNNQRPESLIRTVKLKNKQIDIDFLVQDADKILQLRQILCLRKIDLEKRTSSKQDTIQQIKFDQGEDNS
jgi:hypothetical protein